jgi:acetyl-CoA synthetase
VGEAAVVAISDKVKGAIPDVYVSLRPGFDPSDAMAKKIEDALVSEIGPIARPRKVWLVPDMPKTRSGKIMRRVLAAISAGKDAGDVTTLANPQIVEELREFVNAK